jgi:hypothetical protein
MLPETQHGSHKRKALGLFKIQDRVSRKVVKGKRRGGLS